MTDPQPIDITPLIAALEAGTATPQQQADMAAIAVSLINDCNALRSAMAKVLGLAEQGILEADEKLVSLKRRFQEAEEKMPS